MATQAASLGMWTKPTAAMQEGCRAGGSSCGGGQLMSCWSKHRTAGGLIRATALDLHKPGVRVCQIIGESGQDLHLAATNRAKQDDTASTESSRA